MKLAGYFRYYGITDNSEGISRFRYLVRRLTFKWLNRRSQKKSYTWIRFDKMFKYFEVPKAKIYVDLFNLNNTINHKIMRYTSAKNK